MRACMRADDAGRPTEIVGMPGIKKNSQSVGARGGALKKNLETLRRRGPVKASGLGA